MPNSEARALIPHSRAHLVSARESTIEASSAVPTGSGVRGVVRELSRGWTFTDKQVALLVSAAIFVVGAWPLALGLILAIDRHRRAPKLATAALVTGLAAVTWYAHVFPLLVVHLLVIIEALRAPSWRERLKSLQAMLLPLVPVTALVTMSLF